MNREIIKSASGKTLGYKLKIGGQVFMQDASGKGVGRYDENTDQTFDRSGRAVYKGDQTLALIEGN